MDVGVGVNVVVVHTLVDMFPFEPRNISYWSAFDREWTQAAPQSVRLNDPAPRNIVPMRDVRVETQGEIKHTIHVGDT